MKIDFRKNYVVGLDTETCNGIMVDDKLDLSQSLVYDIGWAITDTKGNVYLTRSYVVREVFIGMFDVMRSAYYNEKIPRYIEQIASQDRIIANFYDIRKQLIEDMEMFKTDIVFAHNMGFDLRALNNTERWVTKSKYRYFFPYDTILWDTLKMANDTFCKQKKYRNWCEENEFMTKHKTPRPRATAEILYRYITNDLTFEEEHTGLEDVLIETVIMAECMKKSRFMPMRKELYA